MKPFYRSVWISDVHVCTKDCRADFVYDFLDAIKCDTLYLVGDIIDVWALRKRWFWPAFYNEVLHKLLKRARKGADVIFIPGNHDDFFGRLWATGWATSALWRTRFTRQPTVAGSS